MNILFNNIIMDKVPKPIEKVESNIELLKDKIDKLDNDVDCIKRDVEAIFTLLQTLQTQQIDKDTTSSWTLF